MIRFYDSLTRSKQPLELTEDPVKIYTCGLTVYSQPHIGNWVAYIYWDILVRLLRYENISTLRVQNITDVGHLTSDDDAGEDKMEAGAKKEGGTAWDIAEKYIAIADHEAYQLLGLEKPDQLVRATDLIDQQIEFVSQLEQQGYTYAIPGDGIYFDTSKLSDYGKLAQLDIAGLQAGARVSVEGKRNLTDFALWKFSPLDQQRDMEWDSPWGKGFPGWHLECSAIIRQSLGDTIDIHTGGIDHIPVHHTNEIAQSETLTSKPLAKIWIHSNHIKVDGRKMSKSLGNIVTLTDIIDHGYSPMAFKLSVISKHYRTEGNFTWEILQAAQNRLSSWQSYAALRHQTHDTIHADNEKPLANDTANLLAAKQAIVEALRDDLDTPRALALIDRAFSELDHIALSQIHRRSLVDFIDALDELLGLQLAASTPDISEEAKRLIIARRHARHENDWTKSDEMRDQLLAIGIAIRDTPSTSIWSYKSK